MRKLIIIILLIFALTTITASLTYACNEASRAKITSSYIHPHHAGCVVSIAAENINNLICSGIPVEIEISNNANLFFIRYFIGVKRIQLENITMSIPLIFANEQTLELSTYYFIPDLLTSITPYNALFLEPDITIISYTSHMYFRYSDQHSFSATGELVLMAAPEVFNFHLNTIKAKGIKIKFIPMQNAYYGLFFYTSHSLEG